MNVIIILKAILVTVVILNGCDGSLVEKRLLKKLMTGYNSMVRPTINYSDLVNVDFGVTLQQIVDLDEKNQLLTTSMYMGWTWYDAHLTWNSSEYENITEVRFPAKRVWKPDILVYNSAVDSFDQLLHTNVVLYSNGKVEWLPPGLFKTTCDVDIKYFPFDEQKCQIKFGAWTYHGGMVNLTLVAESADLTIYKKSGEWKLVSMKGKKTSLKYDCCPYPFIDITYTIHIKRRTLFYGFNLLLPCILVCSLTILIFLLPADSGERITLGITVLLALVVFLQLVSDTLPPSTSIPLLSKYFACSIIMVTISVVMTVISLNFHYATSIPRKMPPWIRMVFLHKLPRLLKMEKMEELTQTPIKRHDNKEDAEIPLVAMGDRLQQQWTNGKSEAEILPGFYQVENRITGVLKELQFITNKMHEDDEDEKIALEWKYAATVLDRFSLWFFFLFFVLSTFFTIAMAPGLFTHAGGI